MANTINANAIHTGTQMKAITHIQDQSTTLIHCNLMPSTMICINTMAMMAVMIAPLFIAFCVGGYALFFGLY